MERRISIQDLARHLGLGKTTVCDALRDLPKVSKRTRARVQQAARELGYIPSPALAAAASRRFQGRVEKEVLLLVEDPGQRQAGAAASIHEAFAAHGFRAESIEYRSREELAKELRVAWHRGIEGVLLRSSRACLEAIDLPEWQHFSVLVSKGSVEDVVLPFDAVSPDLFYEIRLCWLKAVEYGYRKIGLAIPIHTPSLEDDLLRVAGLLAGQWEHPEWPRVPPFVHKARMPLDGGLFLDWFRRHEPEVVIAFSLGYLTRLTDAGYRIPEDFNAILLRVGDSDMPERLGLPALAGLRNVPLSNSNLLVETFRTMLAMRQRGPRTSPRHIMWRPAWVDGPSLCLAR